jgi:hypothetical protein
MAKLRKIVEAFDDTDGVLQESKDHLHALKALAETKAEVF